jgi:hypothetical protein
VKYAVLLFLFLSITPSARAQGEQDAGFLELSTQVGRMLHGYYKALDVATAAITERAPEVPPLYAGGPYDDGWAFSFGELEGDSVFVIPYGVIVSGDGEVRRFDVFEHRRLASPYHTLAARALAAVREDFEGLRRSAEFAADSYRYAVLPFPDAGITAFVSPAQTRPGVTLLGNDVMYTLQRSDVRVSPPTRFHHRLLELPDTTPAGGFAVLAVPDAPLPSPLDVLNTIERGSPLAVAAGRGEYLISPDGTITTLPPDDPISQALRRAVEELER